jgi:tetratricopeptide (TPR) repeat protein
MLGLGWLTLRAAQEALKGGRLDEAQRLLAQPGVRDHKRAVEVRQQLARAFAERGEKALRQDDVSAAWADLCKAEKEHADDVVAVGLRQALTRLGLVEIRALLEVGEPGRATEAIAQLRDRDARPSELELLDEAAKAWVQARDHADRGEFPEALFILDRVQRLLPWAKRSVERYLFAVHERQQRCAEQLEALHQAAQKERWHEVLRFAEEVLTTAPQHVEARAIRARAWKAIEPPTMICRSPRAAESPDAAKAVPVAGSGDAAATGAGAAQGMAFHLWIDGVGGYLVCLGNRITLGQATPESTVDVPLLADVSRLHAALTRDSEGYLLHALRTAHLNGKPVEKALLRNGDRVTLGSCCQLQFRQPVPVSTSARLDLVSGHRLRLAVDGVLLMADTLIIGPGQQVHVQMPETQQSVILFRQKNGLGIRTNGMMTINGQSVRERGLLGSGAHVMGEDFSMTLEPVRTVAS